jgi:histone H2B
VHQVVNGLIEDLENRLTNKSVEMAKLHKKSTLAAKHVQIATKMVVPGEMAAHALSEGTKAVTKFFAH